MDGEVDATPNHKEVDLNFLLDDFIQNDPQ